LHGLDLSTRVAVVTGANTGIGFEISRSLALHGCQVVLACRDFNKAEQAAGKIRSERSHSRCVPMKLDLGCLVSVRSFVAEFLNRFLSLDLLVLNAAVFGIGFSRTIDGLETTFQV
jgi:WW domain-containing oxidoreductase